MKIMLMTDLEGCAGIINFKDWAYADGRYYDKAKRLLTEEVNAAVDGLCKGGATEIVVIDGHGPGAIDPEILDERAKFSRGHYKPIWPWGLDKSFDGLGFIGQHAKAGTPLSHLTHTGSCLTINCTINGISVGEFGEMALCAMELGVPTFLACGEKAFVKEAEKLTPGVVGVAVKCGVLPDGLEHLSREEYTDAKLAAVHLSPLKARKLIREGAEKAIQKLLKKPASFKYPKMKPPFIKINKLRKFQGQPAKICQAKHPSSIIDLMNMPTTIKEYIID